MKKILQSNQILKFILLGSLNTLLDFALLNTLRVITHTSSSQTSKLIVLNIISATSVMVFSFLMNKKFVFNSTVSSKKIVPFMAITIFGIFILQSSVIIALTPTIQALIAPLYKHIVETGVPLFQNFSIYFYETNTLKVLATGASMVWNYLMYKQFIFKDSNSHEN